MATGLARSGHDVRLWARRPALVEEMQATRENAAYLPGVTLPETLQLTAVLEAAIADATVWVVAVPSQAVRALANKLKPYAGPNLWIVSLAKGIENKTLLTTTAVLRDVLPVIPDEHITVLYGPSHAEEVGFAKPTTVVVGASSPQIGEALQELFMTPTMRVYVNCDLIGVEIGGSVKNILALAAGISEGVGYGDNAKAALVTRGIAEIQRLGLALGAKASTFAGLAGIGDLVVTCFSRHSRNRYFGEQIGHGRTLAEIEEEMTMVAEGVRTTLSVYELAQKHRIEMPITEAVYRILFEGKRPDDAVHDLMTREAKYEDWLPEHLAC